MSRPFIVSVSELRSRTRELLDEISERNVVVLRHSAPVGVLVSYERFSSLLERLNALEDELAVLEDEAHPEERVSNAKLAAELGILA